GLPCVVARAPGSRQLVEDGVNGALFAVDDADDLAQALGKVIGEESVLGARSRQIAVAKYDIEKVADQYECLYDQLLSTHER
ncbi:MAG TPA: glycosyltransferase family 1 protein, partial [Chromatiaceae bacterium]|nr:glycosyltransferase family 1 protein [Chromatiaceae bacterium]